MTTSSQPDPEPERPEMPAPPDEQMPLPDEQPREPRPGMPPDDDDAAQDEPPPSGPAR